MPASGGHELRDDDCDRLIWLAAFNDFLNVRQQRFNKEAERRIENDQPCSFAPRFPFFLNLLGLRRVKRNVNGSDIIRKQLCIAQGSQHALVDSTDWQDYTMPRLAGRQATKFI